MAETTLLRQSAIVRNAPIGSSPPASPPRAVKTGELPLVQMRQTPASPQVLTPQPKPVEILPPRDASSALRTGGLPMISVKMTAQGPQLDDGQDKPVVILPSKDQKSAVAAGGLPMVEVKMTSGGPQVQNLPTAQKVPPQIQGPQPAVSRVLGAASTVNRGRVVRVAAPKTELALPPVPELTAEQLLLCRHLAGKYLAELITSTSTSTSASVTAPVEQDSGEAVEGAPQGSVEAEVEVDRPDVVAASSAAVAGASEPLVRLVQATIEMIDQALVAVAVRAEAAALAAAAAASAAAPVPEAAVLSSAPVGSMAPAGYGTSIIPAAPSTSYVAGRVGQANGYTRAPRRVTQAQALAPRRVAPAGELPVVQVKMDGGRAVVQNQTEVAAARAARRGQPAFVAEVPADLEGISPG